MTAPIAARSRIAALVLAAGRSSRMAPHNKLLLRNGEGQAMVARVVAACTASRVARIVVVTGHQAAQVTHAVGAGAEHGVFVTYAADFALGLSASLKAGILALPPWIDGALVCLGDMPLVGAAMIDRLIAGFDPARGRTIVVPTWEGQRGNPVLWGRTMFERLCSLSGDAGAKRLLPLHQKLVAEVDANGPGVLTDYDSPGVLAGGWHAPPGPLS